MVVELVPGVWWLRLRGVNAYLHATGEEAVLVDAGFPWQVDGLRAALAATGTGVADLDRVVLTHADLDHAGGLAGLDLDVPVHAGPADAALLRGERAPPLASWRGVLRRVTRPLLGRPAGPVEDAADGETVGALTAWHTPGHTPGHVAWVDEDAGVVFLGDLARSTGDRLARVPRFLDADHRQRRETLRSFVVSGPAFEAAAVGHGRPLRAGGNEALARLVA